MGLWRPMEVVDVVMEFRGSGLVSGRVVMDGSGR